MIEDTKPAAAHADATDADTAVTEEQRRKAEEYVEAEEGVANRLAGPGAPRRSLGAVATMVHCA